MTKEERKVKLWFLLLSLILHGGIFLYIYIVDLETNDYSKISSFEFTTLTEGIGAGSKPGFSDIPKVVKKVPPKPKIVKENQPKNIKTPPVLTSKNGEEANLKQDSILKDKKILPDTIQNFQTLNNTDTLTSDTLNMAEITNQEMKKNDGGGKDSIYGALVEVQMPRFRNKEYLEIKNWISLNYKLTNESFSGMVWVKFTINKEGKLTDIIISDCSNKKIERELLRILKLSPKWTPGMRKNKPINVIFTMPINFSEY
jgi:periplasmic protein TonB